MNGSTEDMVYKVPELIESLSDGITLEPGDVILTGTPRGVALHTGKYLRAGDIVETGVEKIGVLINPVVSEEDYRAGVLR